MTEDESKLLEQFGIVTESITIYLYKQHRYNDAKDAINFARLESEHENDREKE